MAGIFRGTVAAGFAVGVGRSGGIFGLSSSVTTGSAALGFVTGCSEGPFFGTGCLEIFADESRTYAVIVPSVFRAVKVVVI